MHRVILRRLRLLLVVSSGALVVIPAAPVVHCNDPLQPAAGPQIAHPVFSASAGLHPGWLDYGWAPRRIVAGSPVSLQFNETGAGWIVARPGLVGRFGAVSFLVKAPAPPEDFLDVFVDGPSPRSFPRVRVASRHRLRGTGEWIGLLIPIRELNPDGVDFDRIVFRAARAVGTIELDAIGLTGLPGPG